MDSSLGTFAEELQWCINQLEIGLQRHSPDSRQVAESLKVLKILRSTKAPMVKKRQAMRNALGDYRKKMREAEKKSLSGLRHSRFQAVGHHPAHTKSRYLKHSHSKQQHLMKDELNATFNNLHLQQSEGFSSNFGTSHNLPSSNHLTTNTSPLTSNQSSSAIAVANNGGINLASSCSSSTDPILVSPSNQSSILNDSSWLERQGGNNQDPNISSVSTQQPVNSGATFGPGCSLFTDHHGYKFVPSDNSFFFGFENNDNSTDTENDGNSSILNPEGEEVKENTERELLKDRTDEQRHKDGSQHASQNVFKFEKSNNDFTFNFGDGDNM